MVILCNKKPVQQLALIVLTMMVVYGQVYAHIQTEMSLFSDIKDSDARFDIVVMVAAGIVPESPEFGPDKKLSRADLAAWASNVAGLVARTDKPDVNALAKAALEKGLVKSIEGDATFAEINTVFYQGMDQPEQPDAVPTRAQAASYLAKGLLAPVAGSLLEKAGLRSGPTGIVAKVESRTNPDGGSSNYVTIGDSTLPVYTHAKVGNGPSDITKWKGLTARRTFVRKLGDISVWAYMEGETVAGQAVESQHEHSSHKHE